MAWPWKRFERFYEVFVKRSLVEGLEQRKEQMISALWSNSNWDDDKGTRKQAIEELEENFSVAIDRIMGRVTEEEVEVDDAYGFFAAGERKLKAIETPANPDGTVGEAVEEEKELSEFEKYIDQ